MKCRAEEILFRYFLENGVNEKWHKLPRKQWHKPNDRIKYYITAISHVNLIKFWIQTEKITAKLFLFIKQQLLQNYSNYGYYFVSAVAMFLGKLDTLIYNKTKYFSSSNKFRKVKEILQTP